MELLATFFSVLGCLIQVQYSQAQDCGIVSITSPSASTLNVKWKNYVGATSYFLDLRVINAATVTPVVMTVPASTTEKLVQSLKPGTEYNVTVKAFQFYYVICADSKTSLTVPTTTQITVLKAISSTAIHLEWAAVKSAERYTVVLENSGTDFRYNITFSDLSGEISNLQPTTLYSCSVYSWNPAGWGARSPVKAVTTLVQPPERITVQASGTSTALVSWQKVNKVLFYQVKITKDDNQTSNPLVITTTATYLNVPNLLPCSLYKIDVSSLSPFLEPGEAANAFYTTQAITTVTAISVDYNCANATLTWGEVFGAIFYKATATPPNGLPLSCTSMLGSCKISGLSCGTRYQVQVKAIAGSCEASSTNSTTFDTVACPPTSLGTFRECSSNVIILSWASSTNTTYYVATSSDSSGLVAECRTTETSCFFTKTECGRMYTFSVYAISGQCNSGYSSPAYVQTGPCEPQNVRTDTSCRVDMLTVTWSPSRGALSYMVEALDNTGTYYNCSSNNTSCSLEILVCGQSLSIWLTAHNNECSSGTVLGDVAETVPCPPQNTSVVKDCGSDAVVLKWDNANGAILYFASMIRADGSVRSCRSVSTSCRMEGLRCGETYTAFVITSNWRCNSSAGNSVSVHTALCPPAHGRGWVECFNNTAFLSWDLSFSAVSYFARAAGTDGHALSCNSSSQGCQISGLRCSQTYMFTVSATDGTCWSLEGAPFLLDAAPCIPMNVQHHLHCSTNTLTVSWDADSRPMNYSAIVRAASGSTHSCSSQSSNCSVGPFGCSQTHTVTVTAFSGNCSSSTVAAATAQSVPCVPQNIQGSVNCASNTLTMSWDWVFGAKAYVGMLQSDDGYWDTCSTANLSCSFGNLKCAQQYTLSVVTMNDHCNSTSSPSISLTSVPCDPANVTAFLFCGTDMAMVSWDASLGVRTYMAVAQARGVHLSTCETNSTSCYLGNLACGEVYSVTVVADDGACNNTSPKSVTTATAPCPPMIINTTLDCRTNKATVLWAAGAGVLSVAVNATSAHGNQTWCQSTNGTCDLGDLQCGQTYTAQAVATGQHCNSTTSLNHDFITAPCAPAVVTYEYTCTANMVTVSWKNNMGGGAVMAQIESESHKDSCVTNGDSCSIHNLLCGHRYNASAKALGSHCNSTQTYGDTLNTVPCTPENVTVSPVCHNNTAVVAWTACAGALVYEVDAYGLDGDRGHCYGQETSCTLSQLHCGNTYNISVTPDSQNCQGMQSWFNNFRTVPCPPRNVTVTLVCESNSALVSWTPGSPAEAFLATATASDGHVESCCSNTTSCSLSSLQCGQTYTVHVVTFESGCQSRPSPSVVFHTVICPPGNLTGVMSSDDNSIFITWERSPGEHVIYFLCYQMQGVPNDTYTTANTSYLLTGLQCGQQYVFVVFAQDLACSSRLTPSLNMTTGPCPPGAAHVQLLPMQDAKQLLRVSWAAVNSSGVEYLLEATGSIQGNEQTLYNVSSYWTDWNSFEMVLPCSSFYTMTVRSRNAVGTSIPSEATSGMTAPCPPLAVTYQLANGSAALSWNASVFATAYTVYEVRGTLRAAVCHTSKPYCTLPPVNLSAIEVLASNGVGQSSPSRAIQEGMMVRRRRDARGAEMFSERGLSTPVVQVTQVTVNSLQAQWTPVEGATHYSMTVTEASGSQAPEPLVLSVRGEESTVSGLKSATRYCVSMSARSLANSSPYSRPVCASTWGHA